MSLRLDLPEALPIAAYREQLLAAMARERVVIVCGDTGSGKTTQLPKLALLARPAARGLVGVTQPRRLAAMAMARRLADEVGTPLGQAVGYQHRFERRLSPATQIKLMTDGVLLSEVQTDPLLRRYSTLIIDEAHERSLNIDFLLGLLKRILARRKDLLVIISSATLDAEGFAAFFDHAPVISIPGRLYPIETIWLGDMLPEEDEDADSVDPDDLARHVANAVDTVGEDSGDILVFLPGEREIRETKLLLDGRHLPRTEVLPLLASLPPGEQARVFQSSPLRRIILATNVAETSVTIPGIRVVIDSGLARIKRYSPQRRVQTLRVEKISQASARQRMGRCGRVGPGTCIRLYAEADYAKREAHIVPEIKRSALAGVILRMADLRLGAVETFPFLEPPTGAAIREGYRELLELGALRRTQSTENSRQSTGRGEPRRADPRGTVEALTSRPSHALPPASAASPVDCRLSTVDSKAAVEALTSRPSHPLPPASAASPVDCRLSTVDSKAAVEALTSRPSHALPSASAASPVDCRLSTVDSKAAGEAPAFSLTPIGRALAAFPVEPRQARMLLAAESEGALRDALTVVAALSCEDPLLRPIEKREQADQQHARFRCANSDFLARLKLWAWWNDAALGISETQRRKRCKAAFISYPRMREWANIRTQLEQLCRERHLHTDSATGGEVGLHRALLSALLSRLGHLDPETRDYRGAFGIRFALFPGSGLAKEARKARDRQAPVREKPRPDALPTSREWVLCAELVETSRLFGRSAACIDPRWIEPLAGSLCKVHRHNAFWDRDHGFVRVHEDITLFGLPIASGRLRDLSRLDPEAARRYFIADALAVPDAIAQPPAWLRTNWQKQKLLSQLWALNRRAADALHEALLDFYERALPPDICNAPALKRCPPLPLQGEAFAVSAETLRDFPEEISVAGHPFPLAYLHDPAAPDDGVTLEATPETLPLLAGWHAEWLVPGLLPEKIMWLLNALPSRVRHVLGPLPDLQSLILSRAKPYARPLAETLFRILRDEKGVRVDETPWAEERLPAHLRFNFRVRDAEGNLLGQGRNLRPLLDLFAAAPAKIQASTIADPALARLANRRECLEALKALGGTGWKPYAQFPSLPEATKAFLKRAAIDPQRLAEQTFERILEEVFLPPGRDDPTTAAELKTRYAAHKRALPQVAGEWRRRILYILAETARLERTAESASGVYPATQEELLDQLAWLVFEGFVAAVPPEWLAHYPLFLQGAAERLERARNNPAGDLRKAEPLAPLWQRYRDFVTRSAKPRHNPIALSDYRWHFECLRLATFAPNLRPPLRSSPKQLDTLWQRVLAP